MNVKLLRPSKLFSDPYLIALVCTCPSLLCWQLVPPLEHTACTMMILWCDYMVLPHHHQHVNIIDKQPSIHPTSPLCMHMIISSCYIPKLILSWVIKYIINFLPIDTYYDMVDITIEGFTLSADSLLIFIPPRWIKGFHCKYTCIIDCRCIPT